MSNDRVSILANLGLGLSFPNEIRLAILLVCQRFSSQSQADFVWYRETLSRSPDSTSIISRILWTEG
jgi:hypothetical protein